jgi:hypothetical protein
MRRLLFFARALHCIAPGGITHNLPINGMTFDIQRVCPSSYLWSSEATKRVGILAGTCSQRANGLCTFQ